MLVREKPWYRSRIVYGLFTTPPTLHTQLDDVMALDGIMGDYNKVATPLPRSQGIQHTCANCMKLYFLLPCRKLRSCVLKVCFYSSYNP